MTGTRTLTLFGMIMLALTVPRALRAQDRMRPGLWETTVTSNGKSTTRTGCITAAEAATANQSVQALRESMEKSVAASGKGACKVTVKDFTAADNVVTTEVNCGNISYVNTTTYKGDTVQTVTVNVNAGVTKKMVNLSRRVGACP